MKKEATLTPWEVSGEVDYDRIIKKFGTSSLTKPLLNKLSKAHPLLRRGSYFSHRDFDLWLEEHKKGKKVSVITGRGPSEKMQIGHLVPFLVAKSLQDLFNCQVYIAISDDEKFYVKENLSYEDVLKFSEDNIQDIIALGFDPKKTIIYQDFIYTDMYKHAAKIAKRITYSMSKATFGLTPSHNIGWSFYPAMQAAHILFPQFHKGPHLSVVPVAIDQDPFIRLTRDIATHKSLKLKKPAALHAKFLPSLQGEAKMSSSGEGVIFLNDSAKEVEQKIKRYAFSGGQDSLEEHRKKGGNPDIDVSFQYLKAIFEPSDSKLAKIESDYRKGKLLTSELKKITIEKINSFLKEHQANKKKAKSQMSKFILR
jgi:tryptophanyl-tRNA synthetase